MTAAELFVLVCMFIGLMVLYLYKFIKDDGHKKLVAKFVRFVESRKRKNNKKKKGI